MAEERFTPLRDPTVSRLKDPWWGVHVARYAFAARLLSPGCRVLDIACGTGYGSGILAESGCRVVAADIEPEPLTILGRSNANVSPLAAAGAGLAFRSASFDAVTSFETIEHLVQREQFVAELARVVKPGGTLVLSTPNALYTRPGPDGPSNPFHIHEYEPNELVQLIRRHFPEVVLLGQTMSDRFGTSPFIEDQERIPKRPVPQLRLFVWRMVHKLPISLRERLSHVVSGRPFLPGEDDYEFLPETAHRAPVLVVLARR